MENIDDIIKNLQNQVDQLIFVEKKPKSYIPYINYNSLLYYKDVTYYQYVIIISIIFIVLYILYILFSSKEVKNSNKNIKYNTPIRYKI